MKFYLKTYGCQMNVADSDFISGCLFDLGYKRCESPKDADIVVVNTCTVRQHAEDRALGYLGEIKGLKNKNKKLQLYIVGCVAARLKDTLKKRFPFIDEIIPATEIEKFAEIVKERETRDEGHRDIGTQGLRTRAFGSGRDKRENRDEVKQESPPDQHSRAGKKTRSEFVTISRGCSNYCTYCIVPYVRSEEIPEPFSKILSDIENFIASGHKEVVLLGQNVNSYKDRLQEMDFADLLIKVNEIPEIEKIGFMTSHPKDMSDKIIDAIAECKKVSRTIHLPVQSGSDRVLKLMNRGYTGEHYIELIEKIRKKIPGINFTTDIIVGFPTETEKDFQDTLDLVKAVNFSNGFTFKYSPRETTKAYFINDDVPLEIKKDRLARLNATLRNCKKQLVNAG